MGQTPLSPSMPLSGKGKALLILNLVGLAFIWATGLYAYMSLKGVIPTHFGLSGRPDGYGSSDVFLIVMPLISIAPLIIMLTARYRFTLINKYPYLINLPAFYAYIMGVPFERRAYWVNRYFEVLLAIGTFLTFYLNLLLLGIYLGTIQEALPRWFMLITLLMTPTLVVVMVYYFYRLSNQMKKEMTNVNQK
ncbi:MAG: DUF1648 domain-containing protein [Thaumarchaeota archaeon]|nr:DUF1648 domain-containing protein [Nitrososphaerota archaeon]MCL5318683.1 DUF1648 domain-containing protein [Nitrososphaerota archaeon]